MAGSGRFRGTGASIISAIRRSYPSTSSDVMIPRYAMRCSWSSTSSRSAIPSFNHSIIISGVMMSIGLDIRLQYNFRYKKPDTPNRHTP